jgi:hypothetical protein
VRGTVRSGRVLRASLFGLLFGIGSIAAAACSDGVGTDTTTPTSAPCTTETPTVGAVAPTTVVPFDGADDRTIGLPGELPLPLLVHARHDGADSFVVSGVDATGKATQVFASALGKYDGTFAVGFVDPCATPTAALHVATKGNWHLDFANAKLAPRFDATKGVAGNGDAVLSYLGRRASMRITYSGTASTEPSLRAHDVFVVATYGANGPHLLAHSNGAYHGTVVLPAGPGFIAITAHGRWTIARP